MHTSMCCAGNSLQQFVDALGKDDIGRTSACTGLGHCEVPGMHSAISSVAAPEALKAAAADFATKIGAAQANSVLLQGKETCEFCRVRHPLRLVWRVSAVACSRVVACFTTFLCLHSMH